MSPSILVLSLSPIERDPRVLRQIALLSELGDVHTAGYGAAPAGVASHVQVPEELGNWRSDYRRFYALVLTRQFRRLYDNAPWVRFLRGKIAPGSHDVVVANDAPSVPLARELAPRRGVHADMHEYATRQREGDALWERYQRPVVRWIVTEHLTRVDSVTTVSPGLAEAYGQEFGIAADVVPNAARHRADISVRETPREGPIRLVHTGAAGRARRLEIMIDAVAAANARRPGSLTLDLYLMPGDSAYIAELTRRVEDLGDPAITVLDPVPFDQIVPTLTGYDVGLFVCPPTTFNLEHTVPNKLFEFVQARLGIVIGPSPDMRRYVESYDLGSVTADFEVETVADELLDLTPARIDAMKAAADRAAAELGSDRLSIPWTDAVRRLLAPGSSTSEP
ncbi:MAG: glycosyltransferase [Brachybacterium tyrofermentans]|uniref:Glycosyltransferase n=1 Tax=Brachybacterium tyrofermentans TaxID=47848 RepID=A0ABW0FAC3_9MICO|nr:glycosyltransferase [Brachybacterium tyrofermentans]SLM98564.1 CAPSULAR POLYSACCHARIDE SYNTHESIS ENZYME CAP5I [Corynebacterium xerosis]